MHTWWIWADVGGTNSSNILIIIMVHINVLEKISILTQVPTFSLIYY